METIKVNMSPNPLDVQTIHASQNDSEAREWGFEFHNNGDAIDSSSISDQLVFKSYKGGTEQILPENGAVPVTAPFVGDIKYPDAMRTDQEFLYRQSPTEKDGLAWINSIKGNTLVWNQLVNNGNFADTSAWGKYLATLTVSGNVGTVTVTERNGSVSQNITVPVGHVLLFIVTAQSYTNSNTTCQIRDVVGGSVTNTHQVTLSTTKKTYTLMHTVSANTSYVQIVVGHDGNESGWSGIKISNVMLIDLTQMGLDSLTAEQFISLFPKSYYDYCKGAMLSFGGRNVKFNQLEANDVGTATTSGVTFTKNSDGSWTTSGTATTFTQKFFSNTPQNAVIGHKYLFIGGATGGSNSTYSLRPYINGTWQGASNRDYGNGVIIEATTTDQAYGSIAVAQGVDVTGLVWHPQIFDLTEMFGSGNEPSIQGFKELFPNDYYEYNIGQYMNLGQPVSLKTVGFNQWDEEWEVGGYNFNGEKITDNTRIRNKNFVPLFSGLTYFFKSPTVVGVRFYDRNKVFLGTSYNIANDNFLFTAPPNAGYLCFSVTNATSYGNNVCINISSSKNGTYEPYTSSTLSLPISTYFPNGMKSAGNVYDELTPKKAITRIGAVDLGSLTWYYTGGLFRATISDGAYTGSVTGSANGICSLYEAKAVSPNLLADKQMTLGTSYVSSNVGSIVVRDASYTDISTFTSAMSGVYLYYELATPTETSFTTASLVTENAEIPLSNEDGVLIGKCTEQLSENPGFFDGKIKLADGDGECYSNKIQLHVERSPQ